MLIYQRVSSGKTPYSNSYIPHNITLVDQIMWVNLGAPGQQHPDPEKKNCSQIGTAHIQGQTCTNICYTYYHNQKMLNAFPVSSWLSRYCGKCKKSG